MPDDGLTPLSREYTAEYNATKTILLAEGEKRLRQPVSLVLRSSGYHLIAASCGGDAIQKALDFRGRIHLLLASVEMSDMTGIELAGRLTRKRPDMKFFLISDLNSGMLILDHGWQFLPTPFAADLFRTRLRDSLKEPQPVQRQSPPENAGTGNGTSTKREAQSLRLIAGGSSTKQVAAILGIAFKTAVGHRTRLMTKLHIHDSATLVRYAIRAGHIDS